MSFYNPEMLPKIESQALLDAIRGMPCTLRIASFVPGYACAPRATVVPCHIRTIGKGMAIKVSDIFVAAGCLHCHDLLDRRDSRWNYLQDHYPAAVLQRVINGLCETQTMLIHAGKINIPNSTIGKGYVP